ncbi:hypothetical protein HNY73_018542 [Argiope bruennichi]|uniref:Uncharacterized protein n=1 Tax=Argiope bruennichi TaxID=94029 RepID=A0A8T0EI71_ARGBR|nr:hypothetical protein HNY73_018542 [Argiope bruennichi]
MATSAGTESEFSENGALCIGRLSYDVVVYTLTKCGFPETRLPTTECKETVYKRANIVEMAGASVLRVSLILRDRWRRIFISRRNSCGFRDDNVLKFLAQIAICFPLSRNRPTQSIAELFLALFNEITLFFHHENININFSNLLKAVSVYMVGFYVINEDHSKPFEDLFDEFDNISKYTTWITGFITDFAIPYGSRDDVSEIFFTYVKKQYKDELEKLKDHLGFLPHDLFAAIRDEMLENFIWIPKPPAVPECSGRGDLEERETPEVSEQILQSKQSSSETRLEEDLEHMSLGSEGDDTQSSLDDASRRKASKNADKKKRK